MAMDPTTGKVVGYKPYKPRGLNPHKPKPAPETPPAHLRGCLPRMGNKKRAFARAAWIIERHLRGESVAELADKLKVSERTIRTEILRAENHPGVVEKVRERLLSTLDQAPDVYRQVFDATPQELHDLSRGWALKLKAMDSLAAGVGAFKSESVRETKTTLALVAEEAAAAPAEKPVQGHRILFTPAELAAPSDPGPAPSSLTPASEEAVGDSFPAPSASDSEGS